MNLEEREMAGEEVEVVGGEEKKVESSSRAGPISFSGIGVLPAVEVQVEEERCSSSAAVSIS